MKNINYIFTFVLMVSISFGSENKKLAQTGFQFLSIPADARGGGMAGCHDNYI